MKNFPLGVLVLAMVGPLACGSDDSSSSDGAATDATAKTDAPVTDGSVAGDGAAVDSRDTAAADMAVTDAASADSPRDTTVADGAAVVDSAPDSPTSIGAEFKYNGAAQMLMGLSSVGASAIQTYTYFNTSLDTLSLEVKVATGAVRAGTYSSEPGIIRGGRNWRQLVEAGDKADPGAGGRPGHVILGGE